MTYITQMRINDIYKAIDNLKKEEVTLPADVALGYMTRRPSLLTVGNQSPDRKAILEALAGEMRLNENYVALITVLTDHIKELYRTLDKCGMALEQVERVSFNE